MIVKGLSFLRCRWRDALQNTSLPSQPCVQCPQTHADPVPKLLIVTHYGREGIIQVGALSSSRWAWDPRCIREGRHQVCGQWSLPCIWWNRYSFTRWIVLISHNYSPFLPYFTSPCSLLHFTIPSVHYDIRPGLQLNVVYNPEVYNMQVFYRNQQRNTESLVMQWRGSACAYFIDGLEFTNGSIPAAMARSNPKQCVPV